LTGNVEVKSDMPHGPPTLVPLPFWSEGAVADVVELEQVETGGVHDRGDE